MVFGLEGLPGDRRRGGTPRDWGRVLLDGLGYGLATVMQRLEERDDARILTAHDYDELDRLQVPLSQADLVHLVYNSKAPLDHDS